jgi:thioredoxin-related protein
MNGKSFFLLLILIPVVFEAFAQQPDKEGSRVKWMSVNEALKKAKTDPKPILLDFYTDWCGWCKTMKTTTYADPGLSKYINTYFYPAKFNAEGKDTVEYLGQKYFPIDSLAKSTHPFALKLLGTNLMYPSTVFLNGYDKEQNDFKLNLLASGYHQKDKFEPLLVFTLENAWRNSTFNEFKKNFELTYYDSTTELKQKSISWLQPSEVFNDKFSVKKKSLVLINSEWCSSCLVMKKISFTDTSLTKYLNEKFYLVEFNPEIMDTLQYKGESYYNLKNQQMPFHQLAFKLGRNSVNFPALIVLDESQQIVDVVASYISPEFLNNIIGFYGSDFYKTRSWQDYIKERPQSQLKH